MADGCREIDSLEELAELLDVSNICVRMAPGTYNLNPDNVGAGKLFPADDARSDAHPVLFFQGSNSTFHFDGVTFNFDTNIFQLFGREEVIEFHVIGQDNRFYNLTMNDVGDVVPHKTALAVLMDGADNLIQGFEITTRGSTPYGYGDIFGKGRGPTIGHKKHSGVLIRGDRNHLKGLDLIMRAYGHGIFIQGGDDVLIEDVYVEGELSTVDTVLAERGTGSRADEIDFRTVWGYDLDELDQDYRFSLQEGGIRAYTTGRVYGSDGDRRTGNVTVRGCTVRFMRAGVNLGWASGTKTVDNCTTLGVEHGYWLGQNATLTNSRGDASVGPLITEDRARSNSTFEVTLLDNVVPKLGDTPSLYLAGNGHNVTLYDGTTSPQSGIEILIAGDRFGHRFLGGTTIDANDITLDNRTPYPVVIAGNSDGAVVSSCGSVTDNGQDSSIGSGRNCD